MRAMIRAILAVFCGLVAPSFVLTGQVLAPLSSPPATGPAANRHITLDVVVTDHAGNPVPGLPQQDFTLLDNKKPQTILSFQEQVGTGAAPDPPLQAIVLIDAINSPFQQVAFVRTQLAAYLRKGGGELPLPLSLAFFPGTAEDQTAATRDGNTLVGALNANQPGLRTETRSQGFYGAQDRVQLSVNSFVRLVSSEVDQPGRKLVVWLGPGWPYLERPSEVTTTKVQTALFHNIVWLSTMLRQARMTVDNVDVPGPGDNLARSDLYREWLKGPTSANNAQPGDLALQVLAVESGGQVLNRSNDLQGSLAQCLLDAKTYYTLTFDAAAARRPDEYHQLQIKMSQHGLTARTRTGYYAQP